MDDKILTVEQLKELPVGTKLRNEGKSELLVIVHKNKRGFVGETFDERMYNIYYDQANGIRLRRYFEPEEMVKVAAYQIYSIEEDHTVVSTMSTRCYANEKDLIADIGVDFGIVKSNIIRCNRFSNEVAIPLKNYMFASE